MLTSILGKKVGMTQVFDENKKVVPATVIKIGRWFVCQIKTDEKDGYSALQLGLIKKKYFEDSFDSNWLKSKKKYFESVQEVSMPSDLLEKYSLGYEITFDDLDLPENQKVTASGMSRGKGFQGVIKRWGFSGGPKSHGSRFHRRPGSIGNMCSQGKVIKGKKLPGHTGHVKITVAGLKLIRVDKGNSCLFVHGAVPGSKNTLIRICKQG